MFRGSRQAAVRQLSSKTRASTKCSGVYAGREVAASESSRPYASSSRHGVGISKRSSASTLGLTRSLSVSALSRKSEAKSSPKRNEWKGLPDGWQAVIGVECHAQIKAKTKLFSGECRSPLHSTFCRPEMLIDRPARWNQFHSHTSCDAVVGTQHSSVAV